MIALAWMRSHWRPVAGLAALALAFAFGRYATPPKTVTHETVRTVTVEDTRSKEQVRALTAQITELQKTTHRVTKTAKHADGSSETTTTVDTSVATKTETHTDTEKTKTEEQHSKTDVARTVTKTVTSDRPTVRVSLLAGVELAHLGTPQVLGPIALGGMVEGRILGPVWIGAFGLSSGTAGIALSIEF